MDQKYYSQINNLMVNKKPIFLNVLIIMILFLLLPQLYISTAYGYDTLDPNGNITIKWDILSWDSDNYNAQISILNYQLFRQVENPGWELSWGWQGDEVIWGMVGGEATEQGDCSRIKTKVKPHSCMEQPVIIDLLPGAPYTMQTSNCCKGGVLTTFTQDPSKYGSTFQMSIGNAIPIYENNTRSDIDNDGNVNNTHPNYNKRILMDVSIDDDDKKDQVNNTSDLIIPQNFSIGILGYTCGVPIRVPPSKFDVDKGRRHTQALFTWKLTCTYSQTVASKYPTCCVSMSSFYNETIVPCPQCSCACLGDPTKQCIDPNKEGQPLIELPHSEYEVVPPKVRCTQHMCPIRVHWHVKTSYKDYWRVKVTVTNFNYVKNYSQWSLVVQHPNLQSVVEVFSFNYKPLNQYSSTNDTGMFWGIKYYNDMLLQSGDSGNVQTEILLRKDPGLFTFSGGWAFPRKITFNGDSCVMPPPDQYPRLPNNSFSLSITTTNLLFSLFFFLLSSIILY